MRQPSRFSEVGFESMKLGTFLLFGRTKRPDLHRIARRRFSPLSAGSSVLDALWIVAIILEQPAYASRARRDADLSLRDSRQRHRGGIKVEHRARHSPAIRGGGRLAFQLSEITLQECGIDARRHDPSRSEIPLPPLFIERIINGSPRTGIS